MSRRICGIALVLLILIAVTAGIGAAQDEGQYVRGEPDLSVYTPEPTLTPGSTTELTVQVANDGEVHSGAVTQRGVVTTARSVTIEIEDDDVPFTVETRRKSIGTIADGDVQNVPITVTTPEDIERDEYTLDVKFRYSYTSQYAPRSNVVQERSRTVSRSIDVVVDDGPAFDLRTVDSDVQVGESGTFTTEITNRGGETARNVTLELETTSDDLRLGDTARNTAHVDRLEPGENATLRYEVDVRSGSALRDLAVRGTVQFTDPDGIRDSRTGSIVGLRPKPEQAFSLSMTNTTFRVGGTGTVRGEIRNDGPVNVSDVVLALDGAQLESGSPTYAIGDLAVGEAATFRFRGTLPDEADAVPQQFGVTTRYRTQADSERTSESAIYVPVGTEQDFELTVTNSSLRVGETGTVQGTVENTGPINVRDVVLSLGDAPFTPRNPAYAIGDLAVGESATFRFRGTVPSGADAVPQQIEVATRYRDSVDTDQVSEDSLVVPIADRRDAVAVTAIDPQFSAGEDGVLELDVTNRRDVEIRDVYLRLEVNEPLESEFRTAVIPSLQPGETTRVAFDLEIENGAPTSQFPATVAVEYTGEDGTQNTTRPATVAITVTETDGGDIPGEIFIFAILLLLVAGGGWWFYAR
ncbi:hypothetical protein DQW50_05760 [Halorubrum sp. 48-1-W]|uniref:COG1361 S-layer family protein n=1 Tax=Halorubrum sp. 48-1-W TaxID=2249761 RepID=UPI000DCDE092|nr:NEW3 domain-containing protein [Halorubrum sp. 48-1-W]RAW45981.1 hypothetical protein DQW50_05760 [Halorubrum sp. 48-1-W]